MEVLTLTITANEGRPPMPSPPTVAAARSRYLLDLLAQVPDPRKRRGGRHALAGLLAVGMAAVIAGAGLFAAIGQWAADAGQDVLPRAGAVSSRRLPGGAGRARRGTRACGGVDVPARVRPGQP